MRARLPSFSPSLRLPFGVRSHPLAGHLAASFEEQRPLPSLLDGKTALGLLAFWVLSREVERARLSHSGYAGVRVFEPGDSRAIHGRWSSQGGCSAMPNVMVSGAAGVRCT